MSDSPCTRCGACCSGLRVSFYWGECDDAPGGSVPVALTENVSPHLRAMRVVARQGPAAWRCVALAGRIGEQVACRIYPLRSSTCREFDPYDAAGAPLEACTKARARHGLPPLPGRSALG
ncbi:MAG: YkgJ family cysteine cluster protein [Azovibrio sp.]|nr:YkgJ family cysteine cluster protein [Azovibrio sp.]